MFNFKRFFDKEAKNLIRVYKRLMTTGKTIYNTSARRNKPNTLKRKGNKPWMVATGELKDDGFKYKVTQNTMRVYASEERHSGRQPYTSKTGGTRYYEHKRPLKYKELFELHNVDENVFGDKFPAGSKFVDRLEKEFIRQAKPIIAKQLRGKFKMRIG